MNTSREASDKVQAIVIDHGDFVAMGKSKNLGSKAATQGKENRWRAFLNKGSLRILKVRRAGDGMFRCKSILARTKKADRQPAAAG